MQNRQLLSLTVKTADGVLSPETNNMRHLKPVRTRPKRKYVMANSHLRCNSTQHRRRELEIANATRLNYRDCGRQCNDAISIM